METTTQPANLESNIWKYTVSLITNKRAFVAILGAYYLTIPDVTAQTIGLLATIGSLSGFLFEIPSGYLSDKLGHKQTLVLAHMLMIVSTISFLVADSVSLLIGGSVFMSLSQAFRSGTGAAFMHETLRGLGRENDYAKVAGKASSLGFAIPIALMVSVPFLVSISYKLPFVIGLVSDVVGLLVVLTLVVPHVPLAHVEEVSATNFRQVMKEGFRLGYFKYAMLNAVIAGALFVFAIFRAPYQTLLGLPVIWFGVLLGTGRALASTMLFFSGSLKQRFADIHTFNRFRIMVYAAFMLLLAISTNLWVVATVFVVVNGFQWGLSQTSQGFTMEIIRESKFKATLLSVSSQLGSLISAAAVFGFGLAVARTSYPTAFLVLMICFLVITTSLYVYIVRKDRP